MGRYCLFIYSMLLLENGEIMDCGRSTPGDKILWFNKTARPISNVPLGYLTVVFVLKSGRDFFVTYNLSIWLEAWLNLTRHSSKHKEDTKKSTLFQYWHQGDGKHFPSLNEGLSHWLKALTCNLNNTITTMN